MKWWRWFCWLVEQNCCFLKKRAKICSEIHSNISIKKCIGSTHFTYICFLYIMCKSLTLTFVNLLSRNWKWKTQLSDFRDYTTYEHVIVWFPVNEWTDETASFWMKSSWRLAFVETNVHHFNKLRRIIYIVCCFYSVLIKNNRLELNFQEFHIK